MVLIAPYTRELTGWRYQGSWLIRVRLNVFWLEEVMVRPFTHPGRRPGAFELEPLYRIQGC